MHHQYFIFLTFLLGMFDQPFENKIRKHPSNNTRAVFARTVSAHTHEHANSGRRVREGRQQDAHLLPVTQKGKVP